MTIRCWLGGLLAGGFAACAWPPPAPPPHRVEGADATLMPTLRVEVDTSGYRPAPADAGAADSTEQRLAALALTSASGSFHPDGTTLGLAAYDMVELTGAAGVASHIDAGVRLSGSLGLAIHHFAVRNDGREQAPDTNNRIGLAVTGAGSWSVAEPLDVFVRLNAAPLLFDSLSLQAELGVKLHVTSSVSALVGYRHWRYLKEARTDIDLALDGLVVGGELRF